MSDPLTIIHGDAFSSLRRLPDESVQCCVTSPPYWSLRDYGIEPVVWDETVECEHAWGHPQKSDTAFCSICGAWRGCLGLEPTHGLYVQHIVQVFHELKRVLRADATLWLNLGDSYFASGQGFGDTKTTNKGHHGSRQRAKPDWSQCKELKPKDMVGIPWRCAFALQADGWYLRSDIVWHKPNAMPESVSDRPTKAHEFLFLLTRSAKYYYNAEAIAEEASPNTHARLAQKSLLTQEGGFKQVQYEENFPGRKHRDRKPADILRAMASKAGIEPERGHASGEPVPYGDPKKGQQRHGNGIGPKSQSAGSGIKANDSFHKATSKEVVLTRNKRDVWTIPTAPFSDAHFATFPPDLIKPCILAGAPVGGVVLDPFAGSGTTGKVAIELGRKAILIEPKAEYVEMLKRRCQTTIGLPLAI
jgi:DNA modification methylase